RGPPARGHRGVLGSGPSDQEEAEAGLGREILALHDHPIVRRAEVDARAPVEEERLVVAPRSPGAARAAGATRTARTAGATDAARPAGARRPARPPGAVRAGAAAGRIGFVVATGGGRQREDRCG